MKHEHKLGEAVAQFYVARINHDQTEGRGPMKDRGLFTDHMAAYERVKNQAVMGQGDGDISQRTFYRCEGCPEIIQKDSYIYYGDNYLKRNILGRRGYENFMPDGWRRDYSTMESDPEFEEFLRLKEKFEGNL